MFPETAAAGWGSLAQDPLCGGCVCPLPTLRGSVVLARRAQSLRAGGLTPSQTPLCSARDLSRNGLDELPASLFNGLADLQQL